MSDNTKQILLKEIEDNFPDCEPQMVSLEKLRNEELEAYLTTEACLYWAAKPYWTIDEGAELLNNIIPGKGLKVSCDQPKYTKTLGAKIGFILDAYLRRRRLDKEDLIEIPEAIGEDVTYTLAERPEMCLEWAKSKGLPVPEMLWTAVFSAEELVPLLTQEDVESLDPKPEQQPSDIEAQIESKKFEGAGEKNPESVERGKKKGKHIRAFNEELEKIVLNQKTSECNCNHLKLAAYIKRSWDSLQGNHFGNAKPKSKYALNKDPQDYIKDVCRELYGNKLKEAKQKSEKASSEEETTEAIADIARWKVVVNKHSGSKTCPVQAHNVL